jgi:hypothetical protein
MPRRRHSRPMGRCGIDNSKKSSMVSVPSRRLAYQKRQPVRPPRSRGLRLLAKRGGASSPVGCARSHATPWTSTRFSRWSARHRRWQAHGFGGLKAGKAGAQGCIALDWLRTAVEPPVIESPAFMAKSESETIRDAFRLEESGPPPITTELVETSCTNKTIGPTTTAR